ncbi:MAG: SPFH domain-containing protein [Chloroflexi bacterium]|nr:SPFH domain-containing protein [Chloroflexota bacterium]
MGQAHLLWPFLFLSRAVEVLMRRLLILALLLVALFLAIKLLGAAGVFAFAAACALFLFARSFLRAKLKPDTEPTDSGPSPVQQTNEEIYSGRFAISRNLALTLCIFFTIMSLTFVWIYGGLEWLGMPRIGTIEDITSLPALNFGEIIYPYLPLNIVTEDLKYQIPYANPSDRPLSNVVITATFSLKPQGLAILLPDARSPVTKTMILGTVPPNDMWILSIQVDPPLLKTSGTPWRFLVALIDTVWLRLLWSMILAVLIAVVVALAVLLPVGYFGSRVMYGEYEQYQGHEWEAIQSAIGVVLGINKGVWLVKEGKTKVLHPPAGGLARFGGPGVLIVQEGHAVILEKNGRLSRVVGRGLTWLKPFERVSMAVDLQVKSDKIVVNDVATKDQVLIKEFVFWIFSKVDAGEESKQNPNGLFPFNEENILKNIWNAAGSDWRGGVRAVAETAARDVIGRYELEKILPIADQPRIEFKDALRKEINRVAKGFMGVDVIVVDIGAIKVPEDAEKTLLERQLASWELQILEKRAEAERLQLLRRGEGEAWAIRAVEEAKRISIEKMTHHIEKIIGTRVGSSDVVAARFVEIIEKLCMNIVKDDVTALRYMEVLQKLAESEGSKTLILGEGGSLLGPVIGKEG